MSHFRSVFNNSCVKVPVDPLSKMPVTDYERKAKRIELRTIKSKRCSIDSNSTDCTLSNAGIDAQQVREFYQSIPDYKDIHHLNQDEFYSTLKCLREKKKLMLGYNVSLIDDVDGALTCAGTEGLILDTAEECAKMAKCHLNESIQTKEGKDRTLISSTGGEYSSNNKIVPDDLESVSTGANVVPERPATTKSNYDHGDFKRAPSTRDLSPKNVITIDPSKEPILRSESRSKRNHSACSISWNDQCAGNVNEEVDSRFDKYFNSQYFKAGKQRKSRSMPSSPVKVRRTLSPDVYRKPALTVPKPFKMTLRDDDERVSQGLRCLSKAFSDEMLDRKSERRRFRARAVPVESRIPLYDQIMEDQAMRRAISKINSVAELQAQMRPFSFTKREQRACGRSQRAASAAASATPSPAASTQKFRARPVPRNLFSNHVQEKMREEDFFRAVNRRIRAEELLRAASLPPSIAARDASAGRGRSRAGAPPPPPPGYLPADSASELSAGKPRGRRARKLRRAGRTADPAVPLHDFITTSTQPFHFSTASRACKKLRKQTTEDVFVLKDVNKIYGKRESSPLRSASAATLGAGSQPPASALDVPSVNRSNLAAVLRIESAKKRLEEEVGRRLAEQEHRAELRWRDRVLRRKPAWQLVRNNYEEDIAMRLQTRRDEERLRREEFLHDMELMYGRVRQQPLLFERYYTPPHRSTAERPARRGSTSAPPRRAMPVRSRKVSINETAETINGDFIDYLNGVGDDEKLYSGTESLCDVNSAKND